MAKNKEIRINVTLECTNCANNSQKSSRGISRYITQKNRRNTPNRLELNKFCPYCVGHTVHKEIKK
uniref:Large ribosomal subunit protein bL33c n=1 Tax=Zygnema circumcarinatum TaxID=35869 RepID=RK33_ZYGCR|nr:ribosomal protein L33 [Zygnema circumcarinatum]Q32RH3.1 RecName: Full=Large ribosomal subunit protein bL33c; AltName: Full=50S ribosomal protein L33, chloroplastic [Zygnema circumcarinatum]AAX45858.1 ribosomal protein L33 [Zygnema circumcarinatum]